MNLLSTSVKILAVMAIMIFLLSGCGDKETGTVETWATYNKIDRHTAHINGCPYWNAILRNCFPETLEDKVLDRIGLKNIPKSIPDAYYDPAGQMFTLARDKKGAVPEQFSGYILDFEYIGIQDEFPLKLIMFYSEPGVDRWIDDIKKGVDVKKYSVGDFTVYYGRLTPGTIKIKWAFLDDRFCVMHRIDDAQFKVTNAERFDKLLEMIDTEGILEQIPD